MAKMVSGCADGPLTLVDDAKVRSINTVRVVYLGQALYESETGRPLF
jgi:hypothetical protein